MPSQFDNQEPERLTEAELKDVLRLYQQEREDAENAPRVEDVAEGLNAPVAEIERLLAKVRAQRKDEERRLKEEAARLANLQMQVQAEREKTAQVRVRIRQVQMRQDDEEGRDLSLLAFAALVALLLGAIAWTDLTRLFVSATLWSNPETLAAKCIFIVIEIGLWSWNWHFWRNYPWKEVWEKRRR